MENEKTPSVAKNRADSMAFWVMVGSLFFVPLLFIPSVSVPFQFGKVFLIYALTIVAIAAWTIGRLKEGRIGFIKSPLTLMFVVIPVLFLLSTLFSGSRITSFIGHGYEIGTLSFIAVMFIWTYLVSELFTTVQKGMYAYLAFIAGFGVLALFHIIRLLGGPQILSFGIFTDQASSLIGGWNDLGIYAGGLALFSFLSLELLKVSRSLRSIFIAVLVVSLFLLSVINFQLVWYILGGVAIVFFVYRFTFTIHESRANTSKRTIPLISLIVLIVSCIFILSKSSIYNLVPISFFQRFSVSDVEVRPSWQSTASIAGHSIKSHPVFGTGPNLFSTEWNVAKPSQVNQSIFWSTDFNYGVGLIPTFFVTTGFLGFIGWLVFLVLFIWIGFRAIFLRRGDQIKEYLTVSSFITALYFWVFAFIYVPSAALMFVGFFFTGFFLATISDTAIAPHKNLNFIRDPKTSFVSVLVFIGILLAILISGYSLTRRLIAVHYYNVGLNAANTKGDLQSANNIIQTAIQFSDDDEFYQALSAVNLARVNALLSAQGNTSQDVLRSQFQTYIGLAQAAASAAKSYNPKNYANWLAYGRVFESIVPLKAQGAYENAVGAYAEAQKLNPTNPSIPLVQSRLEIAHGDMAKAKSYIADALRLKSDYTDAIYFLSQIQAGEGDLASAIKSVESATLVSPNDPGVYFQLGLLRYNNKDYSGSASAFEQSLSLARDYANAKYFLGLSYDKLNRQAEAIAQFESLKTTNPGNAEVDLILTNLKAGKDPFANAKPPIDNKPEKRPQPPIKETAPTTETGTPADTQASTETGQ